MIGFLAVISAISGIAMGAAPLLQLRRTIRLNSAYDISVGFFCVSVIGQLSWVIYGFFLHNPAVIVSNGCGWLCNIAVVTAAILIRKQKSHAKPC